MVTFFEVSGATPVTLGSGALVWNQAVLETGGLGVGSYRVSASYGGDGSLGRRRVRLCRWLLRLCR